MNDIIKQGLIIRCPKCRGEIRMIIDKWSQGRFSPYKHEGEWWEEKMFYGYDRGEIGYACPICKNEVDIETEWVQEIDRVFADWNPLAEFLGPVLEKIKKDDIVKIETKKRHGRDMNRLENFFWVWCEINMELYEYGPNWLRKLGWFTMYRIGALARKLKLFYLVGRKDYMAWDYEEPKGYSKTEKQWEEYYRLWDSRKGNKRFQEKIEYLKRLRKQI